jgi:uncharacterized protein (DUF362 family)
MPITRREFVKSGAAAAAVMAAGGITPAFSAGTKSEVYVGKGNAADILPKIIKKMGGMGRFVKTGSRVMIKPNMSFASPPDWGATTSPEAVRVVAALCLDAGARRVIVCDNTLREPEICKSQSGIADAVKDLKGVVVFTPKEETLFEEKSDARARALTTTRVVKEMLKCDCLISLPTAKSHAAGGLSLNLKGLMGLVYDRGAMHGQMDLAMAIAEQLYYIKPTLSIIDASRALLDNGPSGPGQVARLEKFVAGTDPVAVDSFGATLASWYGRQYEGKQVAHIKNAGELGLGNVESNMITEIAV